MYTFHYQIQFLQSGWIYELISLFADLNKLRYVRVGPMPPPPLYPWRRSRFPVQGYTTSNSLMKGLLFVTSLTYWYLFPLRICICGFCFNFGIGKVGKDRTGIVLIKYEKNLYSHK